MILEEKGLDIYDRNYGQCQPEYQFPDQFQPYIKGRLGTKEVGAAYKCYGYGINMNSVQQSQTMFSRRAFEMLASNMIVVGNYSRGMKNYFGNLTICTDDSDTMKQQLHRYCETEEQRHKYRLLGLRKVLRSHLYEDRLAFIVDKVFHQDYFYQLPQISVIARAETKEEVNQILADFHRQSYPKKELYLVTDVESIFSSKQIHVCRKSEAGKQMIPGSTGTYAARFDARDYYGENYLLDLMLLTRCGSFDVLGKDTYYQCINQTVELRRGALYQRCSTIDARCAVLSYPMIQHLSLEQFFMFEKFLGSHVAAGDEFSYCRDYTEASCTQADDLVIYDQGMESEELKQAGKDTVVMNARKEIKRLASQELFSQISIGSTKELNIGLSGNQLMIQSSLPNDKSAYIHLQQRHRVKDYLSEGMLHLCFDFTGDLGTNGVCIFYDRAGNRLTPAFTKRSPQIDQVPPEGAEQFSLAFRIAGSGSLALHHIAMNDGAQTQWNKQILSRSNTLILTNHYPKETDLYRNMFVHKRVKGYLEEGLSCEVFVADGSMKETYWEFEGVNVMTGSQGALMNLLNSGRIRTVCVHFLTPWMWSVLRLYLHKVKIILWIHGAEIQPWQRRKFLFQSPEEIAKAKIASAKREELWKEVFRPEIRKHLNFVVVSNYFKQMIEEDYQMKFETEHLSIIPNYIDTDLFSYQPKPVELRTKIISVRPYASKIYANDLLVKVIQKLSAWEKFNELSFTVIGDGILFNQTVEPLRAYKNVSVYKTFLHQAEIAKLYQTHGIMLIPTRGDTQGVSRDEGMSAGVVPVTNAIAAIPEFVGSDSGILAAAEDVDAMADGIIRLYEHPEIYKTMSENAARRVRRQSSRRYTIEEELKMIRS